MILIIPENLISKSVKPVKLFDIRYEEIMHIAVIYLHCVSLKMLRQSKPGSGWCNIFINIFQTVQVKFPNAYEKNISFPLIQTFTKVWKNIYRPINRIVILLCVTNLILFIFPFRLTILSSLWFRREWIPLLRVHVLINVLLTSLLMMPLL